MGYFNLTDLFRYEDLFGKFTLMDSPAAKIVPKMYVDCTFPMQMCPPAPAEDDLVLILRVNYKKFGSWSLNSTPKLSSLNSNFNFPYYY